MKFLYKYDEELTREFRSRRVFIRNAINHLERCYARAFRLIITFSFFDQIINFLVFQYCFTTFEKSPIIVKISNFICEKRLFEWFSNTVNYSTAQLWRVLGIWGPNLGQNSQNWQEVAKILRRWFGKVAIIEWLLRWEDSKFNGTRGICYCVCVLVNSQFYGQ